MVDLLKKENINNGLINFGGNIYALGTDRDSKPWAVKIKDPNDDTKFISAIMAQDQSISTSGGYERYFNINGKKYSHIIDPRTGYPVNHFLSVTIVSEDPLFADTLSTAFSVLSLQESKKIIEHLDKIGVLLVEKEQEKIHKYKNHYFNKLSAD